MDEAQILNNLRAERERVFVEMKQNLAEAESRGEITSDIRRKKNDLERRVNEIDDRIGQIEERDAQEREANQARRADAFIRPSGNLGNRDMSEQDRDLLDFFKNPNRRSVEVSFSSIPFETRMMLSNPEQRANLNVATYAAGGSTVPADFVKQLYQSLVWNSQVLRAGATVITTDDGNSLILPKTTAHPAAGTIVSEGATIGENDPTFGAGTLNSYKYASLVQVTHELLSDSRVDLLGYLATSVGRALGNGMGAHFTTGTGSSQPTGFVKTGGTVITGGTGQSGIPTADEIIDVYYALSEPYRDNAKWFMSNTAAKGVRKLKASTAGTYQWVPGLGGPSSTIFDRPVFTDPTIAAAAVSGTSVAFGDFSAYHVRMTPLRFERSEDFAWDKDISTFRAAIRADGLNLDTGAFAFYCGGTS